jgi:hypothetical protein
MLGNVRPVDTGHHCAFGPHKAQDARSWRTIPEIEIPESGTETWDFAKTACRRFCNARFKTLEP